MGSTTSPNSFKRLLDSFCTRLSPEGLKILHAFCEDVELFSYLQVKGFQTSHLLRELNNFGLINEDNVQLFKYVARANGQDEILKIVNQFEKGRSQQVKVSASNYNCSDHSGQINTRHSIPYQLAIVYNFSSRLHRS